ncbi:MAG: BatD family protein, partial [Bacillota bacterium]
ILKKAALFPTQTGDLSVTPFELKIPVVVPRQQRRRGNDIFDEFFNDPFFNQGQTVEYNAKSNTIKVTVLPLPQENVPASFKGAVGQYTLSAVMDKNTVKENEPVSLKINITGTGNVNLIDLPEIKLPAGFEKYEPKVNTQVNRASNTVTGQKTIEYLIVPRIQGQRVIEPVEFTYFNPGTKKYVTLKSPEFNLNIEKGDGTSNQTAATGFNKEDVKLLGEDIRFIKTSSGDLSKEGEYTLFSFWFWTLSVLPLIALGGVIAYKKKQDKLSGNVQLMRYQRAEKMARNRLKAAQKSLEAKDQKNFYSEISLALFGYIEDKFHIPKAEFTVDHAVEVLHNNKVPEAMVAEVRNSLEKCEYARFAPVTDGISAMNEMYENAVRIIVELEKGKMKNHQSYMKLSVFIFMLLFSQASLFASSAAEDLMNRANTHYQNGRYEQAVELYQQVIKEGYSGKTLYYNLGNAYFKSGRLGYAILNYEKALKLDPNDEDAAYNLRIANARTVDKIEVMPKLFFVRCWEALLNMFTVNGWTLITFIIYLLLLISTGIYFIAGSQTMQKVSVLTGALTAFLFLCSVLFLLLKYNNDTSRESGIIVEPASTAKLSPDSKSGDAFIIHERIKVDLEDNVADWVKIKLADGKVGWVPGSDLKKI